MATPTVYPFRQALTLALQNLIAGTIAPALNASLAAQFAAQDVPETAWVSFGAQDVPETAWVSFGADQIRVGDVPAASDPVICISASRFENQLLGTRTFAATYITDLILKLPAAADNAPEDFELVQQAFIDAMMDGLTGGDAAYNLNPNLAGGSIKPLPTGSIFRDCYPIGGAVHDPDKLADGVTIVRRCVVTHSATISFTLDRPDALGAG